MNGVVKKRWIYQDQLTPAAEVDSVGNVVTRFAPGYIVKNDSTYALITDHLGSVRLVVNTQSGAIRQKIEYDEYGNITYMQNENEFTEFAYAGGLYDKDTKLTRFGARDYDATTGRWTSKDPILFAGGSSNVYQYCLNDPINYKDITGRDPWEFAREHNTNGKGLKDKITKIESIVDQITNSIANRDAIITFSTNGVHSNNSLHYKGYAIDLRTRDMNDMQRKEYARKLKEKLGADYDVVDENDHIHVEYDPKLKCKKK